MNKPISPVGIHQTPLGGVGTPARNPRIKYIAYASNQQTISATRQLAHAGTSTLARQIDNQIRPGFAAIVLDAGSAVRDRSALEAKLAASTIKWGGEGNVFARDKWKELLGNEENNRTLTAFHEKNGSAASSGHARQAEARRSAAQRFRILGVSANRKSDT